MEASLRHLRNHYRMATTPGGAGAAAARLDRVARQDLPAALGRSLEQGLGSTEEVFLVRSVRTQAAFNLDSVRDDADLARLWANRLAGAIVRAIVEEAAGNVVRFPSRAAFTAQFLRDLLAHGEEVWTRWYYFPFVRYRGPGPQAAVAEVLAAYADGLPALLAELHRLGALDRTLRILDCDALAALWRECSGGGAGLDAEAIRSLLGVALQILERLGIGLASEMPAHQPLVTAYLGSHTAFVDWKDTARLSAVVVDLIRFLLESGYARRPERPLSRDAITDALAGFDWLDVKCLADLLPGVLLAERSQSKLPAVAGRPGPTPRQRRLSSHLLALLESGEFDIPPEEPGIAGAEADLRASLALRIYARLVARFPEWAGDVLATSTIEMLVAAAAVGNDSVRAMLSVMQSLGDDGVRLVRALVLNSSTSARVATAASGVDTGCAGVFLLARAVIDARLGSRLECPSIPLAAIGMRWAGEEAVRDGVLDAGLTLFAGFDRPVTVAEVRERCTAADAARLPAAILDVVAAHPMMSAWGETQIEAALPALDAGLLGMPDIDHSIGFAAAALLRLWACWLRQLASSSIPYLLRNFVRRSGSVLATANDIFVELDPLPMDIVLEMCGYTAAISEAPWLRLRRIQFKLRGA